MVQIENQLALQEGTGHLNGHYLGFHPQIQNIETTVYSVIDSITGKNWCATNADGRLQQNCSFSLAG